MGKGLFPFKKIPSKKLERIHQRTQKIENWTFKKAHGGEKALFACYKVTLGPLGHKRSMRASFPCLLVARDKVT